MNVSVNDSNTMMIGCSDSDLLKVMQERMNGKKVYCENKIIIPIKASPKIYRFKQYGVTWEGDAQAITESVSANIIARKQCISKIKSQYGREIDFDYEIKGKFPPMDHQKIIYNMISKCDVASILAEPGTCKTGAYLWAIDKRMQRGEVKKALIITLNSLKRNVLAEMILQVPEVSGIMLSKKAQSDKILNKKFTSSKKNLDYDIYIANYESAFSLCELFHDEYFDLVLLDEAHRIGSPRSRQTKAIISKFENVKYKYIVTGTLNANNCLSFYMPFRFLGPDTVPSAKCYDFRRMYFFPVDPDQRIWVESAGTKTLVSKIIGNLSVFFSKEECLDLPGIIHERNYCQMETDQAKYYNRMKRDLIIQIDNMCKICDKKGKCKNTCDETLEAKNVLVSIGKLQQIACGFLINTRKEIDDKGKEKNVSNIITFKRNPKLSLLIETLNNIPPDKKVIIWSRYVHSIDIIKDMLGKTDLGEYLTVYKNDDAFQQVEKFKESKYRFLIANPSKAGAGLNIQFSNYQIFFSNYYSYIYRDQAEGRQYREGQKDKVTVIDLLCESTIDEDILNVLLAKEELSMNLVKLSKLIKGGGVK